jgi:hypothetical protein
MSKKKKLLKRLIRCPSCQRNVRPWVLEEIDAREAARPPIPTRLRLRCAAKGCGADFYVVKNAND